MKINSRYCLIELAFFLFYISFVVGCAQYSGYQGGGTIYRNTGDGYNYRNTSSSYPVTSTRVSSASSVRSSREMTGTSYQTGVSKLKQWNKYQREVEIDRYLEKHPEFKTSTKKARIELKSRLEQWDKELTERRDFVSKLGKSIREDRRYNQLLEGRQKTQNRLDSIDASLVEAMIEEDAGIRARKMSWTKEKAQELDIIANNALEAELMATKNADEAFKNVIY